MPSNLRIATLALSFGSAAFLICGVAVFLTIGTLHEVALTRVQTLDKQSAATVVYYTPAAVAPVRTAERRE
jgi:hypothetical protein